MQLIYALTLGFSASDPDAILPTMKLPFAILPFLLLAVPVYAHDPGEGAPTHVHDNHVSHFSSTLQSPPTHKAELAQGIRYHRRDARYCQNYQFQKKLLPEGVLGPAFIRHRRTPIRSAPGSEKRAN